MCVPCVLLLNHGCADHGLVLIILVLRFYNPQAKNLQNILYLAIIRVDGQCIVAAYGKPEYADTAAQVVNAPAFRTKVSTGQRIRKFYIKKGPTATLVTLQHTNVFCSYCCLSNTLHCTHNQCHAIPPPMPPHIATQCHPPPFVAILAPNAFWYHRSHILPPHIKASSPNRVSL